MFSHVITGRLTFSLVKDITDTRTYSWVVKDRCGSFSATENVFINQDLLLRRGVDHVSHVLHNNKKSQPFRTKNITGLSDRVSDFVCLTSTEARRPIRDGDEWEKGG